MAAVYLPALNGGLLWDDSAHVTSPAMRSLHGLFRIWFQLGATQQYYPLLHSAFWVEHRLWGDAVLGYHLTNLTFHALSAFLVVAIMRRLSLPGAWFAAAIFALHPVCIESVAWISEQKNTLSTVFYLSSALFYLRFDRERRRSLYVVALALFVMALLSKSVTATLPAALLVVLWWEKGRAVRWNRDVLPLLPWLGVGAASGFLTAWVERTYIIALESASLDLTFLQRCLLAGRAICFYFAKLFWPSDLMFIYPHWTIDPGAAWQYLFPAGVVGAAAGLWIYSRRASTATGRAPLAAFLCFVVGIAPALGFVKVYPFIYSYVADHFQYQAALAVFIPFAAGMTIAVRRLPANASRLAPCMAALLLAVLGLLTWRQSAIYRDEETLYRETIARNPDCWLAEANLGVLVGSRPGNWPEAIALFKRALALRPEYAQGWVDLGWALVDTGHLAEGVADYRKAVQLMPGLENAHYALGTGLAETPDGLEEAIAEYRTAIRMKPDDARPHTTLGLALSLMPDRLPEAIAESRKAVELDGSRAEYHYNLADALGREPERLGERIAELQAAIRIRPDYAEAHLSLADALLKTPDGSDRAMAEYQAALRIRPHYAEAHYNLGNLFAHMPDRTEDAIAEYQAALRDKPDYALAHCNLGIVLANVPGRLPDAIAQFEAALREDPNLAEAQYDWGEALTDVPGKESEAIAHFRAALRARPDFEPARQMLAAPAQPQEPRGSLQPPHLPHRPLPR
jgi:tetratricopeptide (TPR) repeat protein